MLSLLLSLLWTPRDASFPPLPRPSQTIQERACQQRELRYDNQWSLFSFSLALRRTCIQDSGWQELCINLNYVVIQTKMKDLGEPETRAPRKYAYAPPSCLL